MVSDKYADKVHNEQGISKLNVLELWKELRERSLHHNDNKVVLVLRWVKFFDHMEQQE